jgi:hypothetical protein
MPETITSLWVWGTDEMACLLLLLGNLLGLAGCCWKLASVCVVLCVCQSVSISKSTKVHFACLARRLLAVGGWRLLGCEGDKPTMAKWTRRFQRSNHVLTRDREENCISNGKHRSFGGKKIGLLSLTKFSAFSWVGLTFLEFGKGLKSQRQGIETLGRNLAPKRTQLSLLTTEHENTKEPFAEPGTSQEQQSHRNIATRAPTLPAH